MLTRIYNIYGIQISEVKHNLSALEYVVINFLIFSIPFFLGHPQIVVGVFVNYLLFYSAINFKGAKLISIVILPSVAVLSRGIIFGPLTVYLLWMIPFIWFGNFLLVSIIRIFSIQKRFLVGLVLSAIVKSAFMYSVAFVLVSNTSLPKIFLKTMGIMQLETALIAAVLFFATYKLQLLLAKKRGS